MNRNETRVPTAFAPETRFEVRPAPPPPLRAAHEGGFEDLKARLLAERLTGVWEADLAGRVRRAANEAAALAWVTPYPLLVFPALFAEKTDVALAHAERQAQIRMRSRELLAV
jgi:hypothetical protein